MKLGIEIRTISIYVTLFVYGLSFIAIANVEDLLDLYLQHFGMVD